MPFTAITVPGEATAAYTGTAADSGNGNKYQNDGKLRMLIHNPLGASITLTIVTPETRDGNAVSDLVIGAQTDTYHLVKALIPETYNVASGSDQDAVTMTWSGTLTDVKLILF